MHNLAGRYFRLDGVQEVDELLMAVTLHVAPDHRPIEDIERGKERRRSMTLIIMCHGSGAAFLQRQARLGPVELGKAPSLRSNHMFIDDIGRETGLRFTFKRSGMGSHAFDWIFRISLLADSGLTNQASREEFPAIAEK